MVRGTLRQRILGSVGALVLLSLFGSSIALYRITEVNQSLETINRVSVPLGRLVVQIQSDAEIYRRELDRRLGSAHWSEPQWRARAMPKWVEDVITSEIERADQMVSRELAWPSEDGQLRWKDWVEGLSRGFSNLRLQAQRLQQLLDNRDFQGASKIYPAWTEALENWSRQLESGVVEYDRSLRQTFTRANRQVAELRTGLEIILGAVVSLSLILLWLGERALRPLGELTRVVREIARRGLRKEDKDRFPQVSIARSDEIAGLAREFNRMATTLLEREKTVESQQTRMREQNRLLWEMGELNRNVLNSIDSVLIVTNLEGSIQQCNTEALRWLGSSSDEVKGSRLEKWLKISEFMGSDFWLTRMQTQPETIRIEPTRVSDRVLGGQMMPLRSEGGQASGAILVLEDLTDAVELQERLRNAEKLATVGQLSAQVAHEVRNPLHSIGLEAEMAIEAATRIGHASLKQSLQSILASVDRLSKITENYLKLSRLSAGERTEFDLGDALEGALATYAPLCESQGVSIDWSRPENQGLRVRGDRDLLEHVLGNLLKNAIQAGAGKIIWRLAQAESGRIWLRIEDNGPGIPEDLRPRLFTPFVTTRAQGTGLGLSFVKRVIEDHGGSIECLERGPGEGACFEILMPPAPPEFRHHKERRVQYAQDIARG